jgi:predicted CXXCH cytochrome family protein
VRGPNTAFGNGAAKINCLSCHQPHHSASKNLLQARFFSEKAIMRRKMIQLLLVVATLGATIALSPSQSACAQNASSQGSGNATQSQSSAVRILRPRSGQILANNFVTIRFELMRPNPAGGGNNFVIQLDAHEPVTTSDNEYIFTGMRPGQHVITVAEVDANGTPLPDAKAEVQFTVKSPESTAPPAK